jgi:DNA polymerase-3 subunit chi
MFDGNDENELNDARAQWKALKDAGLPMSYFQQTESGGWEKKA